MKKMYLVSLCVLLAMVFILSACGGDPTTTTAYHGYLISYHGTPLASTTTAKPASVVTVKYGHDMPTAVAPPYWCGLVGRRGHQEN